MVEIVSLKKKIQYLLALHLDRQIFIQHHGPFFAFSLAHIFVCTGQNGVSLKTFHNNKHRRTCEDFLQCV